MVKKINNTHLLLGRFDDNFRFQTFKLRHTEDLTFPLFKPFMNWAKWTKRKSKYRVFERLANHWNDIDRVAKDHKNRLGKVESLHNNTLHRGRFFKNTKLLEVLSMLVVRTNFRRHSSVLSNSNNFISWSR